MSDDSYRVDKSRPRLVSQKSTDKVILSPSSSNSRMINQDISLNEIKEEEEPGN